MNVPQRLLSCGPGFPWAAGNILRNDGIIKCWLHHWFEPPISSYWVGSQEVRTSLRKQVAGSVPLKGTLWSKISPLFCLREKGYMKYTNTSLTCVSHRHVSPKGPRLKCGPKVISFLSICYSITIIESGLTYSLLYQTTQEAIWETRPPGLDSS